MGAAARFAMLVTCMVGCGRISFDTTNPDALDGGAADASFTTRRWVNRAVSGPGPLWGPPLAFHDARGTVLMYGGYYNLLSSHEFWELGASGWTRLCSSCPPGRREAHVMAYDPDRNRLVVFGGLDNSGTSLDDLWEWDGVSWMQVTPAGPRPSPRSHGQMIYDAARRRMVMIGGCTATGTAISEIWEYDGVSWTQRTPAGGPATVGSSGQQIAYDPIGRRVLVLEDECNTGNTHDELWSWDGTAWAQVCTNCSGRPRDNASIVYDEALGIVLLVGGDDRNFLDGTWRLDGNRFKPSDLLPPGRYNMGITYDRARNAVVVYGGYSDFSCPGSFCGETWEFLPN